MGGLRDWLFKRQARRFDANYALADRIIEYAKRPDAEVAEVVRMAGRNTDALPMAYSMAVARQSVQALNVIDKAIKLQGEG